MTQVFAMAALMGLSFMGVQDQAGRTPYDHIETGFAFEYPSDWKLTKKRDHIVFDFNAESGNKASLEVYGVVFTGEIPTWQAVQTNTAKQMKREVVRQWQEEILTVPMLMARTQWNEKDGTPMTADVAMIYADTRRKLLFRLSARAEDIEQVNRPFRTLLQSIKTEDGKLPKPFDPSKPQSENLRRPDRPEKLQVWKAPKPETADPIKGDLTAETTASNIALLVRYVSPWKASGAEPGLTFELPGGPSGIRAIAYSANESDPAGKALIKASSRSLEKLKGKIDRTEVGPILSKSGATLATIWRTGDTDSGKLLTMDAVVSVGDYYVLIAWESTDVENIKLRDQVYEFIQTLSVELKPGS